MTSKTFLFLTSIFLYFCIIQARQDDEFYCKVREDKYKICRRCPNLNEDCEEPLPNVGCKCANLEFANYECKFFIISYPACIIDTIHQFGFRILKMVGAKKQDVWPRINIFKGFFSNL